LDEDGPDDDEDGRRQLRPRSHHELLDEAAKSAVKGSSAAPPRSAVTFGKGASRPSRFLVASSWGVAFTLVAPSTTPAAAAADVAAAMATPAFSSSLAATQLSVGAAVFEAASVVVAVTTRPPTSAPAAPPTPPPLATVSGDGAGRSWGGGKVPVGSAGASVFALGVILLVVGPTWGACSYYRSIKAGGHLPHGEAEDGVKIRDIGSTQSASFADDSKPARKTSVMQTPSNSKTVNDETLPSVHRIAVL
jgi:hypothetical protein